MSAVHARSITHLQEVLNERLLDDDVHRHFSPKAGIQEVLENVHVGENVHDYADQLGKNTTRACYEKLKA